MQQIQTMAAATQNEATTGAATEASTHGFTNDIRQVWDPHWPTITEEGEEEAEEDEWSIGATA